MIPTLSAEKIILAPFSMADAPLVQLYVSDPEIARVTQHIPSPYPNGLAEKWISSHLLAFLEQRNVVFSIRSKEGELHGAINLHLDVKNKLGTLGYWMGLPFWNKGYCTDAARRLMRYGFEELLLNKIHARHLAANPASGRVMQKSGMTQEGFLRQHVIKDGAPMDIVEYGVFRDEFLSSSV
ncbi:MAG: GNAT family N-acetyltransferase [Luteolibacter sp.]|uniref:GNAT family N-acetyltransferase n=1 Tax=Luteolibacter sp. TaxID=1962973 RepID=UPI0032662CB9